MRRLSRRASSVLIVFVLVSGCVELEQPSALQPQALAYLGSVQNEDGGFAVNGDGPSDFSTSAWVALAFGSASPNHSAVPALRMYLANQSTSVRDNTTGSISRVNAVSLYVLASAALDLPDRSEHVERLVAEADNRSLALNEQLFLLGALGRVGEADAAKPVFERVWARLLDPSDEDLTQDAWMRSNAVLALLANNASANDRDMRAAARSVLPFQKDEAGFRSRMDAEPDASTTAVVVAVLSQVRFVYSSERLAGLDFLLDLQEPAGNVRFSQEFDFAPVKTTAEAILATTGDGPFRA